MRKIELFVLCFCRAICFWTLYVFQSILLVTHFLFYDVQNPTKSIGTGAILQLKSRILITHISVNKFFIKMMFGL